jgi:hypothetical protein
MNKPEYERHCREIRKELCNRIHDSAWKQKEYERENARLEKMEHQSTFTRIERAFGAEGLLNSHDATQDNANNISQSFEQGNDSRKVPIKLSTKEKLQQLRAMLTELEHEVTSNSSQQESTASWDDTEGGDDTNTISQPKEETGNPIEENKKPAAVSINEKANSTEMKLKSSHDVQENKTDSAVSSAQAKLAKELIKLANTYKVPELIFSDQANRCQFAYQTWFNKLRPQLAMFPETCTVIQGEKIVPFADSGCVGKKALYLAIGSRDYFQRAIQKFEGRGDQALIFIKNQCASTSADNTHHFHHLFTSIHIKENESATNFFRRFTFARTEAEGVGNTYTDQNLVNFALAGLGTSKNSKYDTAVQLYNLERDSGKLYSLEDIEKKFFAIDEKISREAAKTHIAQGNVAMSQRGDRNAGNRTHQPRSRNSRNPRRNRHNKTADAHAITDSHSHTNLTCYHCGKKGQIAPNCPDKKSEKTSRKTAQGNAAHTTSEPEVTASELVCFARHIELPTVGTRAPRLRRPAPAVAVDCSARHFGDTDVFVTLAVRVDKITFSWERERSLEWGHLEKNTPVIWNL